MNAQNIWPILAGFLFGWIAWGVIRRLSDRRELARKKRALRGTISMIQAEIAAGKFPGAERYDLPYAKIAKTPFGGVKIFTGPAQKFNPPGLPNVETPPPGQTKLPFPDDPKN